MERWFRKSWTTRCSDPTEVVVWARKDITGAITEFQGVYLGSDTYEGRPEWELKAVHRTLERSHREAVEASLQREEQADALSHGEQADGHFGG